MTDIIDEVDALHAKAKQADADLETADIEDSHAFLSISQRHHEFQDAMLNAWPAISARLREAERKAKAFEAIERGFLSSGGLLDVMSRDGRIERSIRLPDEEDGPEAMEAFDLLTAIEAALTEETKT